MIKDNVCILTLNFFLLIENIIFYSVEGKCDDKTIYNDNRLVCQQLDNYRYYRCNIVIRLA